MKGRRILKKLNLKIEYVDIATLNPYRRNVKLHPDKQVKQIMRSIEEFGFNDPIGIDKKDGIIIEGHGRLLAAYKLGITEIPVIDLSHLNKKEQQLYRIAHNKLTMNTDMDLDLLIDEFEELKVDKSVDLTLTGYNEEELEILTLDNEEENYLITGEEDIIPDNIDNICKKGDLWLLGKHRLLCNDCTIKKNVKRLMQTRKADMVFTDPPYGVNYGDKNKALNRMDGGKRIETGYANDEIDRDYYKFYKAFVDNLILSEVNSVYICMLGVKLRDLLNVLNDCGFSVPHFIIWAKNNHTLTRTDYKLKHEFIIYVWKGKHKFYGDFDTTVWEINRPLSSKLHPTMKPIELVARAIKNSSKKNDIVLDLFGGSGSTLIACEQTERVCYMTEVSKHYCDVTLQRYFDYTGKDPIREDGKSFTELRNEKNA